MREILFRGKPIVEDAVEVVRCKDCEYRYFNNDCESYGCRNVAGLTDFVEDDDFCSYGERKENG